MSSAFASFNPILLLIGVIGTTVGTAMLVVARFGRRVNEHPICRSCGYDLLGLDSPKKCPECGSDLTRPREIQEGRRETRRGLLAFSIPVIIFMGAILAFSLVPVAQGINWLRLRPTAWLIEDVQPPVASNEVRRANELARRFALRSIDDDEIDALIAIALNKQADRSVKWIWAYGDMLEIALLNNRLDDDELARFIRNAMQPSLMVEGGRTDSGDVELLLGFRTGALRIGTQGVIGLGATVENLRIDDREPIALESNHAVVSMTGGGSASVTALKRTVDQLPPGEHLIETDWTFEFVRLPASERKVEPLARWETTLSGTIEIN